MNRLENKLRVKDQEYSFSFTSDAENHVDENTPNLHLKNAAGQTLSSYHVSILDLNSGTNKGITQEYLREIQCIVRVLLVKAETQPFFFTEGESAPDTLEVSVSEKNPTEHSYNLHILANKSILHESKTTDILGKTFEWLFASDKPEIIQTIAVSEVFFKCYQALITQKPLQERPTSIMKSIETEEPYVLTNPSNNLTISTYEVLPRIIVKQKTETLLFSLEEIPHFINHIAKQNYIDKLTVSSLISKFEKIIPDLIMPEPQDDLLKEQYDILYKNIQNCITKAKANGKKALILLGEANKNDRKSLILELMALDIAKKLGVNDYFTELNAKSYSKLKQQPMSASQPKNNRSSLEYALELEFNVHASDPEHNNTGYTARMKAIIESINNAVCDSAIFIVDSNHLMDLSQDAQVNKNYEIVTFNTAHPEKIEKERIMKTPRCSLVRFDFFLDPSNAHQLHIPGNPYAWEYDEIKEKIKKISITS